MQQRPERRHRHTEGNFEFAQETDPGAKSCLGGYLPCLAACGTAGVHVSGAGTPNRRTICHCLQYLLECAHHGRGCRLRSNMIPVCTTPPLTHTHTQTQLAACHTGDRKLVHSSFSVDLNHTCALLQCQKSKCRSTDELLCPLAWVPGHPWRFHSRVYLLPLEIPANNQLTSYHAPALSFNAWKSVLASMLAFAWRTLFAHWKSLMMRRPITAPVLSVGPCPPTRAVLGLVHAMQLDATRKGFCLVLPIRIPLGLVYALCVHLACCTLCVSPGLVLAPPARSGRHMSGMRRASLLERHAASKNASRRQSVSIMEQWDVKSHAGSVSSGWSMRDSEEDVDHLPQPPRKGGHINSGAPETQGHQQRHPPSAQLAGGAGLKREDGGSRLRQGHRPVARSWSFSGAGSCGRWACARTRVHVHLHLLIFHVLVHVFECR